MSNEEKLSLNTTWASLPDFGGDEDILAVNKPRLMPTHPSLNHYTDTLANGVMNYYKNREFTFRVITRLDKDTSGLMVIAREKYAQIKLIRAISKHDVVREYGADTLRMYEMFMGPLEAVKPWNTAGVEGVHRFLKRAWRVFDEIPVVDKECSKDLERLVHQTIKKVSNDFESLKYNTAIAAGDQDTADKWKDAMEQAYVEMQAANSDFAHSLLQAKPST